MSSPVLKWPDAASVDRGVRAWARAVAQCHTDVVRIGYFGSYARGDWGPGSDVDLVIVVRESADPVERRGLRFEAADVPVPADVLVYTVEEWSALERKQPGRRTIAGEVVWVHGEGSGSGTARPMTPG